MQYNDGTRHKFSGFDSVIQCQIIRRTISTARAVRSDTSEDIVRAIVTENVRFPFLHLFRCVLFPPTAAFKAGEDKANQGHYTILV